MKIELTDKEIKGIGQGRWMKKNEKRYIVASIGLLIIVVSIAIPMKEIDVRWLEWLSMIIILFIVGYPTYWFVKKMQKVGNTFLEEVKKNETDI